MSKTDGITRSRNVVGTPYKGFSIIRVVAVHHWYNNYSKCYEMSRQYETKREIYYEFCKEGDENRPSCAYDSTSKSVAEAQENIDKFIADDTLFFTDAEREKYVRKPNHKCDYAYGYDSLMKLMREHQKAPKRIQILLEDRLTDANFHSACSYLAKCDYKGFEEFVANDCKFREKFEIYTHTKRKRIKDPKRLEAHIQSAIEEYFKEHKMDVGDTSVVVKFCEEW